MAGRSSNSIAQLQHSYLELFRHHIDDEALHNIQTSWQRGTPLGNKRIHEKIEQRLKMKVGHATRGRPKKTID